MIKTLTCAALALVLALGTWFPATAAGPDALVRSGERPDLVLLFTGDVVGFLDDCGCKRDPAGGLGRRAWVRGEIERKFPGSPFVILDSGNFSGTPSSKGDTTAALLEGMQRLGYDVVNVGERDVRMGYDDFMSKTKDAPFSFVSSNLVRHDTAEPVFRTRKIVEVLDRKTGTARRVGVTGVVKNNPNFLKAGPEGTNLLIANPLESVRKQVEALRAEKVDLVVVLASLPTEGARRLARKIEGIDFILGSYAGEYTNAEERVGSTSILYCGNRGQRMGETRVYFDDESAGDFSQIHRMHFMTVRTYPVDDEMQDFVEAALAPPVGGAER